MAYYCIHSKQNYSNGYTTGEEVLTEETGDAMPKDSYHNLGNGFTNDEYFSTYEEARERFDFILQSYYKHNITGIHINRHDKVKGERSSYDA